MARLGVILLSLAVVGCGCWKLPAIPSGQRSQYYTQQSDGSYKFGFDSSQGLYHVQKADGANEVQGSFGTPGGSLSYTSGVNGFRVEGNNDLGAGTDSFSYQNKPNTQIDPVWTQSSSSANYNHGSSHTFGGSQTAIPENLFEPVTDTPEVAEAKREFLEAYYKAAAAASANPDTGSGNGGSLSSFTHQQQYNQGSNFNQHLQYYQGSNNNQSPSKEPIRYPTLEELTSLPMPVGDTPAVAKAKEAFFQLYQAAAQAAENAPDDPQTGSSGSNNFQSQTVYYHPSPASQGEFNQAPSGLYVAPSPVKDTTEVSAAKQAFFNAYQNAAAAAAAGDSSQPAGAALLHYSSSANSGSQYQHGHTGHSLSTPVMDTQEVKAAKEAFFKHYEAAAAAAEAAPDDGPSFSSSGNPASSSFTSGYSSHVTHSGQQQQQHSGGYHSSSSTHGGHGSHSGGVIHYGLEGGRVNVAVADGSSSQKFGYSYQ